MMRSRSSWRPLLLVLALLLAGCAQDDDGTQGASGPSGSQQIAEGKELYEETCALCHGVDLQGTNTGPPFMSPIYAPNHHPDGAFYAAVADGVQPHHWDFGAMPAQPNVPIQDVAAIVAYVRAQQIEAGITEDPSHP